MKSLSPIILFVYNRPWHTRLTVEALQKNTLASNSELFIYTDGGKNSEDCIKVEEVREYIKTINGFKKLVIIKRKKNWGLADSIIDGVTKIVNEYGRVIVLEDDLFTSPYFLEFMNDGLTTYKDRDDILSLTGFNFPKNQVLIPKEYHDNTYMSYRFMSWGWATWEKKWLEVDWDVKDFEALEQNKAKIKLFNRGGEDLFPMLKLQIEGKIDSWAIRFCHAHYKKNSFCVYPIKSFVNNFGFDGSGVHCGNDKRKKLDNANLSMSGIIINRNVVRNVEILNSFYLLHKITFIQKLKVTVKKIIPEVLIKILKSS
jgi:hypothetical protein